MDVDEWAILPTDTRPAGERSSCQARTGESCGRRLHLHVAGFPPMDLEATEQSAAMFFDELPDLVASARRVDRRGRGGLASALEFRRTQRRPSASRRGSQSRAGISCRTLDRMSPPDESASQCRSAPVRPLPRSMGVMPSTCRSRRQSRRSSRRPHTASLWRLNRHEERLGGGVEGCCKFMCRSQESRGTVVACLHSH